MSARFLWETCEALTRPGRASESKRFKTREDCTKRKFFAPPAPRPPGGGGGPKTLQEPKRRLIKNLFFNNLLSEIPF